MCRLQPCGSSTPTSSSIIISQIFSAHFYSSLAENYIRVLCRTHIVNDSIVWGPSYQRDGDRLTVISAFIHGEFLSLHDILSEIIWFFLGTFCLVIRNVLASFHFHVARILTTLHEGAWSSNHCP